MFYGLRCAVYLCGGIHQHQVFDAGLHGDVGPDQQLQSTDRWKLLKDREQKNNDKQLYIYTYIVYRTYTYIVYKTLCQYDVSSRFPSQCYPLQDAH